MYSFINYAKGANCYYLCADKQKDNESVIPNYLNKIEFDTIIFHIAKVSNWLFEFFGLFKSVTYYFYLKDKWYYIDGLKVIKRKFILLK